ncbi:MAG: endonuclease MutS2, partial [Geopsychrobacter sp.]|nr:endonuclease MutS2 [Geopsychrobacter sp.]
MEIGTSTLVRLEFDAVRHLLAARAVSPPGRQLAEQLMPLPTPEATAEALATVVEAQTVLAEGSPPLAESCSLKEILQGSAAPGSLLVAEQLLDVRSVLAVVERCLGWAESLVDASRLATLCSRLVPLRGLSRRLLESIGTRGELLDSASFELGDMRRESRQLRGQIKQQLGRLLAASELASCFQENLITVRNGRYVVPLKADYRGRIKGLIHDESASGQTLYLEPE